MGLYDEIDAGDKTGNKGVDNQTQKVKGVLGGSDGSLYGDVDSNTTSPQGDPFVVDTKKYGLGVGIGESGFSENYNERARLGVNTSPTDEGWKADMAYAQGKGEKWANAAIGFGKLAVAGVADGIGQWDIPSQVNMLRGVEQDYGNIFHSLSNSIRQNVQENNPIYEQNPGSVDPSDMGWWANQASQMGFSAGLMAEAMGEQALIALATGGAGNLPAAAEKAALTIGQKTLLKNAAFGAVKGVQEGFINGLYTFDETKQKFMSNGYSENEAIKYASAAASKAYNDEVVVGGLLNAFTFASLSYNPATKQTVGLFDNIIKNKIASKAANFATTMASEGFEEGWQNVVSSEGKYTADRMAGLVPEQSFGKRLSNYMTDSSMWNDVIGGALGGAFFHGMETVADKFSDNTFEKAKDKQYQDYKDGQKAMILDYTNQIGDLKAKGLTDQAKVKQNELNYALALSSHHLDRINGATENKAFDNYVNTLQGSIDAVTNNDEEALALNNITTQEQKDQILNTYPSFIADANKMQEIYEKEIKYTQPEAIGPIAYREFIKGKLQSDLVANETALETLKGTFNDYNDLSEVGKQIYDAKTTSQAIDKAIQFQEVEFAKTGNKTLEESLNTLKTQKALLDKTVETLDQVSDDRTKVQQNIDNEVMDSISASNEYTQTLNKIVNNKSELNLIRKELKNWRSPKFQNRIINQGLLSQITKASSVEDLDALQQSLSGTEKQTREIKDSFKKRKADLLTIANNTSNKTQTKQSTEATQQAATSISNTPIATATSAESTIAQENTIPIENPEELYDNIPTSVISSEEVESIKKDLAELRQENLGSIEEGVEKLTSKLSNLGKFTDMPDIYSSDFLNTPKVVSQNLINADMIKEMGGLLSRISAVLSIDVPTIEDVHRAMNKVYQQDPDVKPYMEKLYDAYINTTLERVGMDFYDKLNVKETTPINADLTDMTEEETSNVNEVISKDVGDNDGSQSDRPTYYIGNKIAIPDLKLAFNNLAYKSSVTATEIGDEVSLSTTDLDKLSAKDILDYDKFKTGSLLSLQVNENLPVSQWSGTNKATIQFKDLNLTPDQEEYWLKVPMQVTDTAGNVIEGVFLHDADWYNESNVASTEDQAQIISQGKAYVNDLRTQFQKSGKNSFDIEIVNRTEGTKEFISGTFDELPTLSENNPQSLIGFATMSEIKDVRLGNGKTVANERVIGIEKVSPGSPVELREVGKDSDGPLYLATYPIRGDFSSPTKSQAMTDILRSARRAYIAYLLNNNKAESFMNQMSAQEARDITKEFRDTYGLGLETAAGVNRYLNMIFYIRNEIPSQEYVRALAPGAVTGFFNKGIFTLIKNSEDATGNLLIYSKDDIIPFLRNLEFLQPNLSNVKSTETFAQKFPMIGEDNKVSVYTSPVTGETTYHSFLKDTMRTRIKSWNIGTDESPKYITTVQPVITIAAKGAVDRRSIAEVSVEEQTQDQVEEAKVVSEIPSNETVEAKISDTISSSIKLLQSLGLRSKNNNSLSTPTLTNESVQRLIGTLNSIAGLNTSEIKDAQSTMMATIFVNLNNRYGSSFTRAEFSNQVDIKFDSLYKNTLDLLNDKANEITELLDVVPDESLSKLLTEINSHIDKFEALRDNWDTILSDVRVELEKFVDFKEVTVDDAVVSEENENAFSQNDNQSNTEVQDSDITEQQRDNPENWDKDGFQENYKNSVSLFVRRGLFTIPEYTEGGDFRRGAFGNKQYRRFEDNYNILMSLIAGNNKFLSSTESLKDYLSDKQAIPDTYHSLAAETVKLIDNNQQFTNALQYALTKSNTQLKMVVEQVNNKTGVTSMKVWDVNSNEVIQTITSQWREMNKKSSMIEKVEDEFRINPTERQKLIDTYNGWLSQKETLNILSPEFEDQLKSWLDSMGMIMNPLAIRDLIKNGYTVKEEGQVKRIVGKDLISNSKGVINIFGKFLEATKRNTNEDSQDITENVGMNIFDTQSTMVKNLATINQKYMGFVPTQSFRDAGKQLYGFENLMKDSSITNRLKYDPTFRERMSKTIFKGDSYVLKALNESSEVLDGFGLVSSAITSIKMYGKDNYGNFEVKDLAEADLERFSLGLFTNQSGDLNYSQEGIPMRMSTMLSLVSSDKKRRNINKFPILNLSSPFFDLEEGVIGDGVEAQKLKGFLFNSLVLPELKRIVAHQKEGRNSFGANTLVNQKDYNYGAQLFLLMPFLNEVKMAGTEQTIISYLQNDNSELDLQHIIDAIQDNATKAIVGYINSEAKNSRTKWNNLFDLNTDDDNLLNISSEEQSNLAHIDTKYVTKFGSGKTQQLKGLSLDYTINSLLNNLNNYQLYLGDVANFAQDKFFKVKKGQNAFFEVLDGKVDLSSPKYEGAYTDLVQNYIGVNLGKRAAMLIAPGSTLANSENDNYMQVFVNDASRVSEDTVGLIRLFYGDSAANQEESEFAAYKGYNIKLSLLQQKSNLSPEEIKEMGDLKTSIAELVTGWQDKYPSIAGYFDIESTDAQEYTTWKEHLRIIDGQGRISPEQLSRITNDLTNGRELNKEDLKFVFQPIKPVFAGEITEPFGTEGQLRAREVYIKSSQFPLLPQFTKGTELEGLRNKMEELETKSGKNVRVSYGTANKVGAVGKPITIWDADGNFIRDSFGDLDKIIDETKDSKSESALVLPRTYFRVQQDVPFKSSKNDYDKITLGTQLMKIAFSNEVRDLLQAKYGNDDVFNSYQDSFKNWLNNIQSDLYNKLGLGSNGEILDKTKTITKIKDMLSREAKQRNYPQQDIDILSNLLSTLEFEAPLWLSPNSNRYEAFVNALLNNKFSKLKLPGASFIVGSEEGFITPQEAVRGGKVVYTSAFTGRLKPNQALVPSKFRDNRGNMIDLTSNDYSTRDKEGKLILREDKFDPELLKLISFRIPTSGHVSGSQIEIAGFLPYNTGDLAIYGKDMTKQKGLDFDVDKENTYWLHHFVDIDGNVKRLSESEVASSVKTFKDLQLTDLQKILTKTDQVSRANNILGKFISDIFDVDIADIEGDLEALSLTYKKGLESKLHQNTIIDAYHEIFGSDDPAIQKKIRRVLSTDFAEGQASMISGIVNKVNPNKGFSLLSSGYQNTKMELGAVGKMGIGVYANYVTYHALSQQTNSPVKILEIERDEQGNEIGVMTPNFVIGRMVSDGSIGNVDSIKPDGANDTDWNEHKRSISEIFDERANTATDNEKLQIMGIVGINAYTINLDSFLSLLGFDKDIFTKDGKKMVVNVPYFIMSQPIVKDYINELKNSSSQIAEFDLNKKLNIQSAMNERYGGVEVSDSLRDEDGSILTGENLYDNLSLDRTTLTNQALFTANRFQQAVFRKFLEMNELAEKVQQMQSHLNIQKEGLGKSFFDAESKKDNLMRLSEGRNYSTPNYTFRGVEGFVGDFIERTDESIKIGQRDIGGNLEDVWFTPTTPTGSIMKGLIKSYDEVFKQFFPQDSALFNDVINKIIKDMGAEGKTSKSKIELKFDITTNIKKYMLSNLTDLYSNAQQERHRLLFDTSTKQSLATYLMNMKFNDNYSDIIAGNSLLSQFDFTINKDNEPSMIVYRNSRGEDIQEDFKYQALIDLLAQNPSLPEFNGKAYTAKDLVDDLVKYSFVIGGMQEANEFVKYIPLSMLREYGITDAMRGIHSMLKQNRLATVLRPFMQQYFQHNPGRATKVSTAVLDNFNTKSFNTNTATFTFKADMAPEVLPSYLSVYNQMAKGKGKKKNQLYKLNMISETEYKYERLPLLGTTGMVEYSFSENQGNVSPLIDKAKYAGDPFLKPDVRIETVVPETIQDKNMFNINSNNLNNVLESIVNSNSVSTSTKDLVSALRPYLDINTKLVKEDLAQQGAKGLYDITTNTIKIDKDTINNDTPEEIALTVLKEYVHSITFNILQNYYQKNSETLNWDLIPGVTLPSHISALNVLFNKVQREAKDNPQWQAMIDSLKVSGGLSTIGQYETYGALNIMEFVSEIFGNRQFQEVLSKMTYPNSSETLLDRFKKIITQVLSSLGLNFKPGTALYQGLSEVFTLLDRNQNSVTVEDTNPVAGINDPMSQLDKLDELNSDPDLDTEGEPEVLLSPSFSSFSNEDKAYLKANGVSEADYLTLSEEEKQHFLHQLKEKC